MLWIDPIAVPLVCMSDVEPSLAIDAIFSCAFHVIVCVQSIAAGVNAWQKSALGMTRLT